MTKKEFYELLKSRPLRQRSKKKSLEFAKKFIQANGHAFYKKNPNEDRDRLKLYGQPPTDEQVELYKKWMSNQNLGQRYPSKLQKRIERAKAKYLKRIGKLDVPNKTNPF